MKIIAKKIVVLFLIVLVILTICLFLFTSKTQLRHEIPLDNNLKIAYFQGGSLSSNFVLGDQFTKERQVKIISSSDISKCSLKYRSEVLLKATLFLKGCDYKSFYLTSAFDYYPPIEVHYSGKENENFKIGILDKGGYNNHYVIKKDNDDVRFYMTTLINDKVYISDITDMDNLRGKYGVFDFETIESVEELNKMVLLVWQEDTDNIISYNDLFSEDNDGIIMGIR